MAHEFGPKGIEVVEQLVSLAGGQQKFESLLPFPLPDRSRASRAVQRLKDWYTKHENELTEIYRNFQMVVEVLNGSGFKLSDQGANEGNSVLATMMPVLIKKFIADNPVVMEAITFVVDAVLPAPDQGESSNRQDPGRNINASPVHKKPDEFLN